LILKDNCKSSKKNIELEKCITKQVCTKKKSVKQFLQHNSFFNEAFSLKYNLLDLNI